MNAGESSSSGVTGAASSAASAGSTTGVDAGASSSGAIHDGMTPSAAGSGAGGGSGSAATAGAHHCAAAASTAGSAWMLHGLVCPGRIRSQVAVALDDLPAGADVDGLPDALLRWARFDEAGMLTGVFA